MFTLEQSLLRQQLLCAAQRFFTDFHFFPIPTVFVDFRLKSPTFRLLPFSNVRVHSFSIFADFVLFPDENHCIFLYGFSGNQNCCCYYDWSLMMMLQDSILIGLELKMNPKFADFFFKRGPFSDFPQCIYVLICHALVYRAFVATTPHRI